MSMQQIDLQHWQDIDIPPDAELFELMDQSTINKKHAISARDRCQALAVAMTRLQMTEAKPIIACQRRRQAAGSSWILLCTPVEA